MNWDWLKAQLSLDISSIALASGTSPEKRVFILGPYRPERTLSLLTRTRDQLRARPQNYTTYLESEFSAPVDFGLKCKALFELSSFALFIITAEGIGRGWPFEVGDIQGYEGDPLAKLGFYYEDYDALPATIQHFIGQRIRQLPIVRSDDPDGTAHALVVQVNSFFVRLT